jgi:hypothetical protein
VPKIGGLNLEFDRKVTTSLTASCLTAAAFPVPLGLKFLICACYPDDLLGIDMRRPYKPHQKSLNSTGKKLKPLLSMARWACSITAMTYIWKHSDSNFFQHY